MMAVAGRAMPNTEAEPDRKVEMPMFSLLGLVGGAGQGREAGQQRGAFNRAASLEVFMVLSPVL